MTATAGGDDPSLGQPAGVIEEGADGGELLLLPTGVDEAQAGELEIERQAAEPVDDLGVDPGLMLDLVEEVLMLAAVLLSAWA